METLLEKIKQFADRAHGEQMRKYTPERYIVHPVRVMESVKKYTNDDSVLAAALLHDVLEDTATTKEQIEEFLNTVMSNEQSKRVVRLVLELTDVYTKSRYPQWNRYTRKRKETARLEKTSAEAQTVKYADLIDNMKEIVNQDPDFAKRYLGEAKNLLKRLKKGNTELRELAINTLEKCLKTQTASRGHNRADSRTHSSPHSIIGT